ncbi:MAG: phospho-N-acetylmuramoyl-pentapeptide-transferase [Acidobacteria bacterium]|nr:phospho-N-acetylmuramoyl-pentapeptide-transferase [Acidobacteriota bacterium]
MKPILFAAAVGLLATLVGTPLAIRALRARGLGQLIREDIGHMHGEKRGTPTMGGIVILSGIAVGYLASHTVARFSRSGILVLGAMAAMGLVGLADDYIKIRHQRSLGLNKTAKAAGQALVAVGFAVAARSWVGAPTELSFVRQTALDLGIVFVLWGILVFAAATNGVNLTDGLDGLAAGSGAMVFAAYVVIAFWQFRHLCPGTGGGCYQGIRDPLDLAIVAAASLGACAGFLWWNAAPAKIFMGDTGSLAIGAGIAALAMLTATQLLLVVLGGLFVLETTSVIIQVAAFHGLHRRVFRMAPLHHHFELAGWPEFTVIVRFWIIAGLCAALGIGLFYAEFLARGGVG